MGARRSRPARCPAPGDWGQLRLGPDHPALTWCSSLGQEDGPAPPGSGQRPHGAVETASGPCPPCEARPQGVHPAGCVSGPSSPARPALHTPVCVRPMCVHCSPRETARGSRAPPAPAPAPAALTLLPRPSLLPWPCFWGTPVTSGRSAPTFLTLNRAFPSRSLPSAPFLRLWLDFTDSGPFPRLGGIHDTVVGISSF